MKRSPYPIGERSKSLTRQGLISRAVTSGHCRVKAVLYRKPRCSSTFSTRRSGESIARRYRGHILISIPIKEAVAGFEPATSWPVPCICQDPRYVANQVLYPLSYTAIVPQPRAVCLRPPRRSTFRFASAAAANSGASFWSSTTNPERSYPFDVRPCRVFRITLFT